MPVVQPYRSSKMKQVKTKVQNMNLKNPDAIDAVNKRKQLQAFPPNFIHSLDATHMFLSAIKSHEVGLTFSSVHDSFWTHAADIPLMNRVLRDAFVAMHSEDIIGRLHEEFTVRYKGSMYLHSVHLSSPLAAQIKKWRHASNGIKMLAELCMEHKRWNLLNSDKEEDRQKGREMVTPAALYDKAITEHPEWLEAYKEDSAVTKLGQQDDTGGSAGPAIDPTTVDEENEVDEGDDEVGLPTEQDINDEIATTARENAKAETTTTDAAATDAAAADAAAADAGGDKKRATQEPKRKVNKHPKKYSSRKFWLPMSFPDVPAKGEFDVRVLRDSQYFFS